MYTPAGEPAVADTGQQRVRLDRVANAPSILDAIRAARDLTDEAAAEPRTAANPSRGLVERLTRDAHQVSDSVVAIAAVHALAGIPGVAADRALLELLVFGRGSLPEHVAWAAARRAPSRALVQPLIEAVAHGGLAGMHAQAALGGWSATETSLVVVAIRAMLGTQHGVSARSRLVETLGMAPGKSVSRLLTAMALDAGEADAVRAVAIAALGDRSGPVDPCVAQLATGDGVIARAVRGAIADSTFAVRSGVTALANTNSRELIVAQVHLGAHLDPDLLRSGMGDTGGVATLLVKLGNSLAATPSLRRVLTIGRGSAGDGAQTDTDLVLNGSHEFASVSLGEEQGAGFADPWPAVVAAERGIRRIFRESGRPDVVHLRMADVGTLAAARVAEGMGIPVVFSLAPDPHGVIAAREAAGSLDRRTFADEDAGAHLWYRLELVERLAAQADEVVLFPRARLVQDLRDLVGIDVHAQRGRFTVVPEGIDVAAIRRAVSAVVEQAEDGKVPHAGATGALPDLLVRLRGLSPARHGLPIVLSVGRLSELKGMARLVEAFVGEPGLRERATLVIVGGNLDDPSVIEARELDHMERSLAGAPGARDAVVLLGHRPNGEIAELLAAARHGAGTLIGRGGAYACASRKEEFGLAIVEALAAGLPVVAPIAGGPATYVEQGTTGVLVDTMDAPALAHGVAAALDLAREPALGDYAADVIARRYDISEMARALTVVYARAAANSSLTQLERLAS